MSDLLARVKWKSVSALVLLIAAIILVLWALYTLKPFQASYKGVGDVQARFWVEPPKTGPKGTTTVWVEVKNKGQDTRNVSVSLESYSKNLLFETREQKISKDVEIGSGESRQLPFKASLNASYGGRYGMKAVVSPGGENIEEELFVEVFEKQ